MPAKRKSKTELPESKRSRDDPVTFVVSGQNYAAVVVGLLKEQEREITVLIASDVAAARQMVADSKKQQTIEVISKVRDGSGVEFLNLGTTDVGEQAPIRWSEDPRTSDFAVLHQ